MKIILILLSIIVITKANAQTFIPKDSVIANNVFQVEFSDDSRSMVWCENIGSGKAKIWYADLNLYSGLPNFATKQLIDTIQGQGWPYWGQDSVSKFFLIKNQNGHIKYIRRTGFNTLTQYDLGTVNLDDKSLLNVNSDSTKNYLWVNYVVMNPISTGLDSLFAFRSDNPTNRIFINAEKKNAGGGAYELTFPRWLARSELLAYPFRPFTNQPYWDMKFWNGQTHTSTQITNDIPSSFLNHHVDDLPFRLPQFPNDTFMFSSKAAQKVAIYQKTGQYFTQVQLHTSPTPIIPTTLTSFEPFTICNNKTYGTYQVYAGGGMPGTTAGEIYLLGIYGDTMHIKISTFDGDVTVDPEYVIGNNKVWIYYYGKPTGSGNFNLHRCETPLVMPCFTTGINNQSKKINSTIYPNPFSYKFIIKNSTGLENYYLSNILGQLIWSGKNIEKQDFSNLANGIYFLKVTSNNIEKTIKMVKIIITKRMPAHNNALLSADRTCPVAHHYIFVFLLDNQVDCPPDQQCANRYSNLIFI